TFEVDFPQQAEQILVRWEHAVVETLERSIAILEKSTQPPKLIRRLEQRHPRARRCQEMSCGQAGDATTDDPDAWRISVYAHESSVARPASSIAGLGMSAAGTRVRGRKPRVTVTT